MLCCESSPEMCDKECLIWNLLSVECLCAHVWNIVAAVNELLQQSMQCMYVNCYVLYEVYRLNIIVFSYILKILFVHCTEASSTLPASLNAWR